MIMSFEQRKIKLSQRKNLTTTHIPAETHERTLQI